MTRVSGPVCRWDPARRGLSASCSLDSKQPARSGSCDSLRAAAEGLPPPSPTVKLVHLIRAIVAFLLIAAPTGAEGQAPPAPAIHFRYPAAAAQGPLDGRLILILSTDLRAEAPEPRLATRSDYLAPQVFGFDLEGWAADTATPLAAEAFGFPIRSLAELPAGEYVAQAVFHRYERVTPRHGKTILVPWDRGEGQQWNRAPGNLYSTPRRVRLDPRLRSIVALALDQVIPAIAPPADTEWVKHIKVRSKLLSDFWGRPIDLGAHVLLPWGFADHPEARYPLMIFHGHFPADLGGFRPQPPDPDLPCEPSERFGLDCYNRTVEEEAHKFYQRWTSPGFPRFLAVEIQHPTPFYDDSYAVNSANNGPYGDAITRELIPEIERRFRAIGAPWARFLYGGSTGGWEALAAQIFYPDDYNGAFGACPDPVDFRAFELVDLYAQQNAYWRQGPFTRIPIPAHRNYLGQVSHTTEMENHLELALGSRGRSGGQFDGWQAVYSPVGDDGYPAPIFDKLTGEIDRRGRRSLAGELRPAPHPRARLGGAGAEAPGQAPRLRRRHGQLLPEQRRLSARGVPRQGPAAVWRRDLATATASSTAGTGTPKPPIT